MNKLRPFQAPEFQGVPSKGKWREPKELHIRPNRSPHKLEVKTPGATSQAGKPSKRSKEPGGGLPFLEGEPHLQEGAAARREASV